MNVFCQVLIVLGCEMLKLTFFKLFVWRLSFQWLLKGGLLEYVFMNEVFLCCRVLVRHRWISFMRSC